LHRLINDDYPARASVLVAEREALETEFARRIDAALGAGDTRTLRESVNSCWRDADAAEARWLSQVEAAPARAPTSAYRRSWARLSQVAGLARPDAAAARMRAHAGEAL
jgi:hypothetical protein